MSMLKFYLWRIAARLQRDFYAVTETAAMNRSLKAPLDILFSHKEDWEPEIAKGFAGTRHTITFDRMSPESIAGRDLVVPLTIEATKQLHGLRHLIRDNPIPIPSLESLLLCDDKYRFNMYMQENGFAQYLPAMGGNIGYPYVLKKRIDQGGRFTYLVSDAETERQLEGQLSDEEYYRQQHIGAEYQYCSHILIRGEKPVFALNVRYGLSSPFAINGKDLTLHHSFAPNPHLHILVSMLNHIGFEGLCNIDYREKDGRPQILEINPRPGGSLNRVFFSVLRHLDFKQ